MDVNSSEAKLWSENMSLKSENENLKAILRDFSQLSWMPDAAPGPSFYMVEPVHKAREVLRNAGIALTGQSPFPSDINGSLSITKWGDGKITRGVWLDGMCYGEEHRDRVPEKHIATFDAALAATNGQSVQEPK